MWLFDSKKRFSTLYEGLSDSHSHLLPGVDDGVRTMGETLAILTQYEELGVKELWLTPHIMEDIPNTTDDLKRKFDQLLTTYTGKVTLHLASENMLDILFEERLASNDFLPIGEEHDHLLVETSYFNPPMDMENMLQRIQSKGYIPLLAHPERYRYMGNEEYERLHEKGVKFQLNLFSLVGFYGENAQRKAQLLLEKNFYTVVGSDLHKKSQLDDLKNEKVKTKYISKIKELNKF